MRSCATARAAFDPPVRGRCSPPPWTARAEDRVSRRQRGRHDRLAGDHGDGRGRGGDRGLHRAGGERQRRAALVPAGPVVQPVARHVDAGGVRAGGVGGRARPSVEGAVDAARPGVDLGAFASLVDNHGIVLVLLGFALAVAFGAWHALLPGHGKTLMAAYMVGSETKVRQAVAVGSAVAVMHTASVLGLGLLVITLEQTFRPESLYPWLGLLSGVVAIGLGAYLTIGRLTAWSARTPPRHTNTTTITGRGTTMRTSMPATATAAGRRVAHVEARDVRARPGRRHPAVAERADRDARRHQRAPGRATGSA